ncbi:hypothetical protein CEXT_687851 [Caerostris extrusa]|uniref:Uncharacterized protein n=1 Tax=Caerostris extrusa TaxID=172846 RepID=A0AAV4QRM3_CAEEX|nr:hypothetical protein CEXT_687851 [Caerostris extrusa]
MGTSDKNLPQLPPSVKPSHPLNYNQTPEILFTFLYYSFALALFGYYTSVYVNTIHRFKTIITGWKRLGFFFFSSWDWGGHGFGFEKGGWECLQLTSFV